MSHSRILSTCLICLFIAACNTQEQTTAVKKTTETRTVPEIATPEITAKDKVSAVKTRSVLNLSTDNIPVEHQGNGDDIFNKEKDSKATNSALFETPGKDKTEPRIHFSGKLFTNEAKLDNKQYLDSVEGVQINIEGSFN